MRSTSWSSRFLAIVLLLLVSTPAAPVARGKPRQEAVRVMDFLPVEYDRSLLSERSGVRRGGVVFELEPPDSKLMAALRWAYPDPARQACKVVSTRGRALVGRSVPADTPASDLLNRLLDRARKQILIVDLEGTLETLEAGRDLVPCLEAVLPTQTVARLLEYEAVTLLFLDDPRASRAFLDLVAVAPEPELDPSYPPSVGKAFMAALRTSLSVARVEVALEGVDDPVLVDGLPADRLHDVLPGRHLVQIRGPDGRVRSRLVTVPEETAQWRLSDTALEAGLISSEDARRGLARSLVLDTLSTAQRGALDACLARRGGSQLVLAVAVHPDAAPNILTWEPGGVSREWELPEEEAGKSEGASVTVSLGPGTRWLSAEGQALLLATPSIGYTLRAAWTPGIGVILADVALFPHIMTTEAETRDCGGYTGEAPPTEDQVAAAAACVDTEPLVAGALGAGALLALHSRVQVVPAVLARALHLPRVLVGNDPTIPGDIWVTGTTLFGAEAWVTLAFEVMSGRPSVHLAVDVHAGYLKGRARGQTLDAYSSGVGLRAALSF